MPSRNIVKTFVRDGYYHVYNRGIDKRDLFIDQQDISTFFYYIQLYLTPKFELIKQLGADKKTLRFLSKNLSEEVELLVFAVMPNHFHLLVKQKTETGISKFMQRLITAYVVYFNKKYQRRGPLFENIYKACNVMNDSYLLHLSRYIHCNPNSLQNDSVCKKSTSLPYYLGERRASWINTRDILLYFNSIVKNSSFSYFSFINEKESNSEDILGSLVLETD